MMSPTVRPQFSHDIIKILVDAGAGSVDGHDEGSFSSQKQTLIHFEKLLHYYCVKTKTLSLDYFLSYLDSKLY